MQQEPLDDSDVKRLHHSLETHGHLHASSHHERTPFVLESLIGEASCSRALQEGQLHLSVDMFDEHVKCTWALGPLAVGTLSCPWEHTWYTRELNGSTGEECPAGVHTEPRGDPHCPFHSNSAIAAASALLSLIPFCWLPQRRIWIEFWSTV